MSNFDWTCPYCQKPVTITDENYQRDSHTNYIKNDLGRHSLISEFIVCPNAKCKKPTLSATLYESSYGAQGERLGKIIKEWSLIPASSSRTFPDFIPIQIRNDYEEACLIKDLSPKASATLARRCLQGMIRNFWGIEKNKLIRAIEDLEEKVDPLTWKAIDAVRTIGNIGAHMEADIDLIIDVDPHEADLLIGLIETLLEDWYIAKKEREARLQKIVEMGTQKEEARQLQ